MFHGGVCLEYLDTANQIGYSLNVINRLLLSDLVVPKVISFSGFYSNIQQNQTIEKLIFTINFFFNSHFQRFSAKEQWCDGIWKQNKVSHIKTKKYLNWNKLFLRRFCSNSFWKLRCTLNVFFYELFCNLVQLKLETNWLL